MEGSAGRCGFLARVQLAVRAQRDHPERHVDDAALRNRRTHVELRAPSLQERRRGLGFAELRRVVDGGLRPQGQALEGLGIPEEVERELPAGPMGISYQQGRLLDRVPVGPGARCAERSWNHLDRSRWIPELEGT